MPLDPKERNVNPFLFQTGILTVTIHDWDVTMVKPARASITVRTLTETMSFAQLLWATTLKDFGKKPKIRKTATHTTLFDAVSQKNEPNFEAQPVKDDQRPRTSAVETNPRERPQAVSPQQDQEERVPTTHRHRQ